VTGARNRHSSLPKPGQTSQPAEAFKETSTGDNVSLDTCRPGMDIVLQVTNTSDTAQDFRAALFGDAIE